MSTQKTVLDIAMNLTRMGNWAAEDFDAKQKRITTFLTQTSGYVATLRTTGVHGQFARTFTKFEEEFSRLEKEAQATPRDTQAWAEKMMTWGNILTHRAKLIPS